MSEGPRTDSRRPADQLPPWQQATLQQLLRQRGHAWLLHGPSGLGQYPLALALARSWLCEAPGDTGEACGQCGSCHAVDVRTHADLCVLMPEALMPALDWPLDEKAQQELDDKKRKPSREIRVEALREAVGFAQRTSARGRGKVVLVHPAERMNGIAANTLLKTLEEPAPGLRFVLASEAAHLLLPTIRSRCQSHALAWPGPEAAVAWLQAQGLGEAEALAALRAAGGRPDDALRWARAGGSAQGWALFPRAMARGEVAAVADWPAPQLLAALQKLCHDLLARSQGAAPRFFAAADLAALGAPALPALAAWSRELLQAQRSVEHPFNPGLMAEALVGRAQQTLNMAGRAGR